MSDPTRVEPTRANFIKSLLILFLAVSIAMWKWLDYEMEEFYIFTPDQLHTLAKDAIATHGNDTRSVVQYIVDDLKVKPYGKHINLDEEWVFNNAGGAMGAMYIIHASESSYWYSEVGLVSHTQSGITEYLIIFGKIIT